jgi:hypothetical protein
MKNKIIFVTIFAVFTSSSAFALTITSAGSTIGGGIYKPSTGVTAVVFTDDGGTKYAGGTTNAQGKKEYATNSTDPKIYQQDAATPGTSTVDAATWTASGTWVGK